MGRRRARKALDKFLSEYILVNSNINPGTPMPSRRAPPTSSALRLSATQRGAQKAAALLKLLANARRLSILCHLTEKNMSVNALADAIGLSQSALSQHLARLRADGLVTAEKRGQMVYYRVASREAKAVLAVLERLFCPPP